MHDSPKLVALREQLATLAKRAKLGAWNEFVEPLKVPREFAPAMMTGRPELIGIAGNEAALRDWTLEERRDMVKLITGLIETNQALQEHAQRTAQLVDQWQQQFKGLESLAAQIRMFGNFRHAEAVEVHDEGEE